MGVAQAVPPWLGYSLPVELEALVLRIGAVNDVPPLKALEIKNCG